MDDAQVTVTALAQAFQRDEPGRSVVVRSLRGPDVDVQLDAETLRPAASLLKVPLVAAVYAKAQRDDASLDTPVSRSALGTTEYPSILAAFSPDHMFSVRELCSLCLVTSDNPVADYLLDLVGSDLVNATARVLGCTNTELTVGFSDDALGERGRCNVSTARDAAQIFQAIAKAPEYKEPLVALRNNLRNIRISLRIPAETDAPHKTGSLATVANDAGLLYGANTDLVVAFMCDEQPDIVVTSLAIGNCVGEIWEALGEEVEWPRRVSTS